MVNEVIADTVRHNNWATGELLSFVLSQELTREQRTSTGVGTFGTIGQTLDHIIRCDAAYLRRLADIELPWVEEEIDLDLVGLQRRAAESARCWELLLGRPLDTERVIVVDGGEHAVRAGVILAQAVNHANHHREQVCAILTGMGIQPPDIQAWEYAWRTGRIWVREQDRGN